MALPKQVQAQLKEIEAIEKQLTSKATDPEPNTQDTPAASQEYVSDKAAEPVEKPETPSEPKPVEVKPDRSTEPQVSEETWQQKYKTLKGMYDAEVPRLHAQVKELTARLDNLQSKAESLKQETKAKPVEKLVTEADVEAFGSDLIEVQRKVAREVAQEFAKDIEDLRAENAKLREQLTETGSQVSTSTFEQRLHRLVPDFDEINVDPKWIDWLNEIDPMLRAPRKAVAQRAFESGDAEGVAYYVDMFKKSTAPVEPTNSKNKELERQVQPNRGAASATPTSSKGKTYTNAQIQAMFQKAATLGGQGKLEEARKLEAEIDAAFMEGRVTA